MRQSLLVSSYDSPTNSNYGGGGAIAVHELARRLSASYQVTVVTGKYSGWQDKVVDGVSYRHLGTRTFPLLDQGLFHLFSLFYALTHQYDLWIESFTPPAVTGLIPLLTRRPVIGLAHMLPGQDMARKYKLPFYLLDRLGLKLYRHVITTSEYFAKVIKKANPNAKVVTIPNGVELVKARKAVKPKHILWLGRIEVDQKGLDLLIKAYRLVSQSTKYSLVIAGSGSASQVRKLRRLIDSSGIKSRIRYVGRVGGKKKSALLAAAAVLVVSSRFETFSMVAAEGMAAGAPLVTFDIAGLRWIPARARAVAANISAASLAKALAKSLADPKATKERAAKARQLVANHSWDAAARAYTKLIREVLHG